MGEREKRSGIKSGVTAMANATAAKEEDDGDVFWGGESWEFSAAAGQNDMIVEIGEERDLEVGWGAKQAPPTFSLLRSTFDNCAE